MYKNTYVVGALNVLKPFLSQRTVSKRLPMIGEVAIQRHQNIDILSCRK